MSENLILIIGNGFDLAHNLKTSYNHFANHIIEDLIPEKIINLNYEDIKNNNSLIKSGLINLLENNPVQNIYGTTTEKLSYGRKHQDKEFISNIISKIISNKSLEIYDIIDNQFLIKLLNNQYDSWFDIENAYFIELTTIHKKSKLHKTKKEDEKKEVIELNENLVQIKKILFDYLKSIKIEQNPRVNLFFRKLINKNLKNIYIINFNYTITIENYSFQFQDERVKTNYIHGDTDSENIIFGYGNDKNTEYNLLKDTEINDYLKFFKTFEYLSNNKYSKIYTEALDILTDYQVAVLGHSLGQTDKTLLKEILDNDKCKKIHLFKRNDLKNKPKELKEEFDSLIYSASRIIDDERKLRIKITNYEDSLFFP